MKRIKISFAFVACMLLFSFSSLAQEKKAPQVSSEKVTKVNKQSFATGTTIPSPVQSQEISSKEKAYRDHLKQTDTPAYRNYLNRLNDLKQLKEMFASDNFSQADKASIKAKIKLIQTELDLNK